MKWGRRKAHKNLAPTADKATDHSRPNLRRKSLNELSDAELRELTTRMQLEKQYKDLNKKELSIGKKFVNDVLNESAKKAATAYVSKYMVKGLDSLEKALKGATK
jgi:molecular chaperone GrpE (heat shock protein)